MRQHNDDPHHDDDDDDAQDDEADIHMCTKTHNDTVPQRFEEMSQLCLKVVKLAGADAHMMR